MRKISVRGFSTILIIVIGLIVLGVGGLIFASANLRGTNVQFGDQPKSLISESKEPSSENTSQESKLEIKEIEKFYPVIGATILDLHNFLLKNGPGEDLETGHKGVASCRLGYKWMPHVSSNEKLSLCKIDWVELQGTVECTYPKWESPSDATQETKDKWDAFMKKVRLHEQGHIDVDKKWLNVLFEELKKIEPKSTCENIKSEVQKVGEEVIKKSNGDNRDYDLETQHGEKQGVYLIPPN